MTSSLALLTDALALVGHGSVIIWTMNVTDGMGYDRPGSRFWPRVALLGLVAVGLALLGAMLAGWPGWALPLRVYSYACVVLAALVIPGLALVRGLRRKPAGIRGRTETLDFARLDGRDTLIGPGKRAWMLRLPANEALQLDVREWDLHVPGLPRALDGLAITHLTDLHFSPTYTRRYFDRVIDQVAGWDADLVLFTGDLADDDSAVDWVVPVLGRLEGRFGQFSILGNHDRRHHPARLRRSLKAAGYVDLEGTWTTLDVRGQALAVGGSSFPWGRMPTGRWPVDADFRLLMSHSPDLFPWAASREVDLILAGHNHGGQVRLPLLGPILMPSRFGRRYDRGFFASGRTRMYVSQGIGAKDPLRYGGCRPEVARIVLRASGMPAAGRTLLHEQLDESTIS
ncbi:metallophosphoesterase [Isosphaeraceae bacterium EP7]